MITLAERIAEAQRELALRRTCYPQEEPHMKSVTIRVGQRLIHWDGVSGSVDTNSRGASVYGPGEPFQVVWLDADGSIEDAEYLTLEQLEAAGVRRGRGVMPWAR